MTRSNPLEENKIQLDNESIFALSYTYATHNPALIILSEKGYRISISDESDEGPPTFVATSTGRRFAAGGGAELLGLVTIWEHFGENWNVKEPDIMGEALSTNEIDEQPPG